MSVGNATKAGNSGQDDVKVTRKQRQALRKKQNRKLQMAKVLGELAVKDGETKEAATRKERKALNIKYMQLQRQKKKCPEKVRELEDLVKAQKKEIEDLKKLLQLSGTKLEPTETATVGGEQREESTAEDIQDQLQQEAEEVAEEDMDGLDASVEYPTLPSTEVADTSVAESTESAAEVMPTVEDNTEVDSEEQAAAAAAAANTEEAAKDNHTPRDSSADSHAGTPRNLRRSPRKKRRSFAGHSY